MTPRRVLVALGLTFQIVLPTALLYAAIDPGVYPGASLTSWASLPWMAGCLLTTAWLLHRPALSQRMVFRRPGRWQPAAQPPFSQPLPALRPRHFASSR